jgi:hypothetical protein
VLAGDANAFERLETFLIAFLNTDMHAKRVAGLEDGSRLVDLCGLDTGESINDGSGQRSIEKFKVSRLGFRVIQRTLNPKH